MNLFLLVLLGLSIGVNVLFLSVLKEIKKGLSERGFTLEHRSDATDD